MSSILELDLREGNDEAGNPTHVDVKGEEES